MIEIDWSGIDSKMSQDAIDKMTQEECDLEAEEFNKWLSSEEGQAAIEMIEAQYRAYQNLDNSAKT